MNQSPIPKSTHLHYLTQTLNLARQSPPKPTNFRVGCVIVSFPSDSSSEDSLGTVLSTGYTLELPGNTHAEQCALAKLPSSSSQPIGTVTVLYTSLEPCSLRLSGSEPCVQRIITHHQSGGISKVVFGAKEPGTFVKDSQSCRILSEAGVEWEYLPDLEEEILRVAMAGHVPSEQQTKQQQEEKKETRVDDISPEERKRQEALPRNPKKRMMELEPQPQARSGSGS